MIVFEFARDIWWIWILLWLMTEGQRYLLKKYIKELEREMSLEWSIFKKKT